MDMVITKEIGKHLENFCFFSDQDLQRIRDIARYKKHKKGQVLFDFGDSRDYAYILMSGIVRLERLDESASFNYLHFIKEKCMFPLVGLFTDSTYYFSAVAHTEIEVIKIPISIYEEILKYNNQQLCVCLTQQSEFLKEQIFKIQKGMVNNADYRILTILSIIYKNLGEKQYPNKIVTVPCPISVNDIAKASGITRETTSLVLKKLIASKKIKYKHKELTFIDIKYFNNFLTQ
ncbi:Crp/Fnr family transcriptional regulator [Vagococcus jeotgali]|uniref:Crp/Fnr family transcriptional regulator n=1 Tax=Vagococcus jeotgali TaxID=3109030 RepID=UPI002DD7ED6A|nr:Crp/Fnr family transcriptional regulator [Vagococcus sp. B2T-5]